MTQTAKQLTLTEYLNLDAEAWVALGLPEGRCVYIDGEVVELPPESEENDRLALNLRDRLLGWVGNDWLIRVHTCELEVPRYERKDPATCFPDLVVLREEHLPLLERRTLLRIEASPPRLVAEMVSPGKPNHRRDFERKRRQYAGRGIPEYWLLEPRPQQVRVWVLVGDDYEEMGIFTGDERLRSPEFPGLTLTAAQMLNFVGSRLREEVQRAEAERSRADQAEQRVIEEHQRTEQERQRAEQAEQQAEQERQRAEQAEQQAEQERQRAEQAEQQAEQERQRAEQAEQQADQLRAYLRSLGIDPDRL